MGNFMYFAHVTKHRAYCCKFLFAESADKGSWIAVPFCFSILIHFNTPSDYLHHCRDGVIGKHCTML